MFKNQWFVLKQPINYYDIFLEYTVNESVYFLVYTVVMAKFPNLLIKRMIFCGTNTSAFIYLTKSVTDVYWLSYEAQ